MGRSRKNFPILSITVLNNLGVMYFRWGKFELAEDNWMKSRKLARKKNLLWAQAIIDMNLGDHIAHNQKRIKRGKDLIRNARKIMESLKDMEGVADSHFNYALVCIEEENFSLAMKHFIISMKYPIFDETKRSERIKVFNERLETHGQKMSISFK